MLRLPPAADRVRGRPHGGDRSATSWCSARRPPWPRAMAARLERAGLPGRPPPRDWARGARRAPPWSAPGPRPGRRWPTWPAIVVLDEHDEAHQQEQAPTWHARDVAIERARAGRRALPADLARARRSRRWRWRDRARARTGPSSGPAGRRSRWSTGATRTRAAPGCSRRRSCGCCARTGGSCACSTARAGPGCSRARPAASWPAARRAARPCAARRRPACASGAATDAGPLVCLACGGAALQERAGRRDPGAGGAGGAGRRAGGRAHRRRPTPCPTRGSWSAPRRCSTGSTGPTRSRSSTSTRSCWPRATGRPSRRWRSSPARPGWRRRSGPAGERAAGHLLLQTRLPDHEVVAAAVHGDPERRGRGRAGPARAARLPALQPPWPRCPGAGRARVRRGAGPPAGVERRRGGRRPLARPGGRTTGALCDALAAVKRPAGRLRIEVDPLARLRRGDQKPSRATSGAVGGGEQGARRSTTAPRRSSSTKPARASCTRV